MSDLPTRPRPGRGASRPSPAAFGLVRVGPDFEQEFPDADRSSTEAYASLVRTGVALTAELDRAILATFDVPHAVLTALAVVEGAGEPLTPSQISERVLVPSATMTATLDALERRGWVVRRPNAADRRSLLVEVTDEGRAVAGGARGAPPPASPLGTFHDAQRALGRPRGTYSPPEDDGSRRRRVVDQHVGHGPWIGLTSVERLPWDVPLPVTEIDLLEAAEDGSVALASPGKRHLRGDVR